MAGFRFRPNPRFEAEVRRSPEFRRFTLDLANRVARAARAHSSEGFMGRTTTIRAEQTADGARVVHDSPGWHLEEFGSSRNTPRAPLRKGCEAAGVRFELK